MEALKADVAEVFSSIQGEGIFLGARQVFVRFKDCNMKCVFCDEPRDSDSKAYSPRELMNEVKRLGRDKKPHHSVSLTGGEPLLYADFLMEFLKLLKKEGSKTYLETNGTLPGELSKVINLVDIIAMDIKLPSSTGDRAYWREHEEFLNTAVKKKAFVKVVVTPNTTNGDIERAARLVKKIDKKIPFILQPATPVNAADEKVENSALLGFLEMASGSELESVRAIPQIHKMLNMR